MGCFGDKKKPTQVVASLAQETGADEAIAWFDRVGILERAISEHKQKVAAGRHVTSADMELWGHLVKS